MAGAWAAAVGLAVTSSVVLLAWLADPAPRSAASVAVRTAGHAWLLGSGVSLQVPGGRLGLVPLGAAVLPVLLLWRAGAGLARSGAVADLTGAARAAVTLGASYGGVAALVAALAGTVTVRAAPVRALAVAGLGAMLVAGAGALRGLRLPSAPVGRLPVRVRALASAGTAGLLVLAAAGALLAGTALGWHAGRSGDLARAVAPGVAESVGLLIANGLLLPNAVIWAACFAVGPGFAVGAGTSVSLFGVSLGAVPALPLLAALPAGGGAPLAALPVLLAPVAAGVVVARVVGRRLPGADRRTTVGTSAGGGALAGVALGVAAWLSGGPAGPGRLATTGPSPWQVGLVAAAELALVAAAVSWWWPARGRLSG